MISGNGWRMLRWFIVGLILFWGWNAGAAPAAAPSLDCARAAAGSIEAMICTDPELRELDRALASVYGQAARKAGNERPPLLKAAQRGWIKGRNDCWKSDDKRRCVADSYSLRIVELQARYRLADRVGPVTFQCDHNPANEVIVTWFATNPPTLIAERGDQVSLMVRQPGAVRYQGRNELLWEERGETRIVWGAEAPEMGCVAAPQPAPPASR